MTKPRRVKAMIEDGSRHWFVEEPGGPWYLFRTGEGLWLAERARSLTHHPSCFAWRMEEPS